jgi:hypothetical protein
MVLEFRLEVRGLVSEIPPRLLNKSISSAPHPLQGTAFYPVEVIRTGDSQQRTKLPVLSGLLMVLPCLTGSPD